MKMIEAKVKYDNKALLPALIKLRDSGEELNLAIKLAQLMLLNKEAKPHDSSN
jgi:hypothetical protein